MSWEESVLWLKSQPNQQDLVKACFYDDPLLESAERYYHSTEWKEVGQYLPKVGRVLDLGAGRGISAYAFARGNWQVSALEPNPSNIVGSGAIRALAEQANLNIEVTQTWGEKLPYDDAIFDVVHGRQVLHHAYDLKQLCSEAARVLKPGGIFIATREHVISKKDDLSIFLNNHPLHNLYGGEHAYLLDEYKQAIRLSGIRLKKVLNPLNSNINLYPETKTSIKMKLRNKLHLSFIPIPDFALSLANIFNRSPGRLYTFIGEKVG
jgi:SAM-dependent methyltransferase